MAINPQNFRRKHLSIRNKMTEQEVKEKSILIMKQIMKEEWYEKAEELFAYYPLGNEVDCRSLIRQAWKAGKRIALPRTAENYRMDFFYVESYEQLEEGRFHVMEPKTDCIRAFPGEQPVIVPGSVFGRDGSRYGYGKGYYDRFFSVNPNLNRYGVCYLHQLEEQLITTGYDVPMHVIYTESECIKCVNWKR